MLLLFSTSYGQLKVDRKQKPAFIQARSVHFDPKTIPFKMREPLRFPERPVQNARASRFSAATPFKTRGPLSFPGPPIQNARAACFPGAARSKCANCFLEWVDLLQNAAGRSSAGSTHCVCSECFRRSIGPPHPEAARLIDRSEASAALFALPIWRRRGLYDVSRGDANRTLAL